MALRSIWGNKGRSVLTMLGIIIGIAAVMAIVSLIQGLNQRTLAMYEAMGTNKIEVYAYSNNGLPLFDELYDYCVAMGDDVVGITPQGYLGAKVTRGVKDSFSMNNAPQMILGSHQYALCNNFQIARGRDLTKLDVDDYHNVCVLGSESAKNFFDLTDPLGETIAVDGIPFTVVGIYVKKDTMNDPDWLDNVIVFPYTAARTLKQDMSFMSEFAVKAKDADTTPVLIARLSGFLTGLLGDPQDWQNQRGYFNVYSQDQWRAQEQEMMTMASLILGGIAGISLLVGGIGIMNIMLVTVTERTREIGVRRAIGAKRSSIITQFLIEAGVICGIGGVIGAGLGTGLTVVGGKLLLQTDILPTPTITLLSVAFAVALGMVFGLYPAIKASGLQPVVALRAE
jgi:putative ABC transport system permease protein